eukprot:CAMPEP_0184696806 /NCGR_PEP_ID=MMETSP0313-20130426/3990_1 /TAXON_ID=2792 /ORGANISM="Porphyridium aerugineum, Strain SAG 1380-2" /LENGTH=45 /DNA_ID= /DNA_START= /DNA_END= /DNA_ORIENTATION=
MTISLSLVQPSWTSDLISRNVEHIWFHVSTDMISSISKRGPDETS